MRTLRLLAATALTVTGLVAVGASGQSAQAASSTTLKLSSSQAMKDEYVHAYGEVSGGARVVKLQYRLKSKGSWSTWRTGESTSEGEFGFEVKTSKSRYVRYYAPRSGSKKAVTGTSRKLSVVGQTASAFVVPGTVCKSAWMPDVAAVATFKPAREGRQVTLTIDGTQTDRYTDANGRVIVYGAADLSSTGTKKVSLRADSFNGSAAKSVSATYRVVTCVE